MARAVAGLPLGSWTADYVSLWAIARTFRPAAGDWRRQFLSANPFRGAGGKRHSGVVGQPNGYPCRRGITLAKAVPPCLCGLWKQARASGADLLWRVKQNMRLVSGKRIPDRLHVSWIYPSERDWRFLITITSGGKSKPPWTSWNLTWAAPGL